MFLPLTAARRRRRLQNALCDEEYDLREVKRSLEEAGG
jgi:hypothetical protein